MDFATAVKNESLYRLVEVCKDGMSYLMVMNHRECERALAIYRATGHVSTRDGFIIWQGEGKMPEDLHCALCAVGLGRIGEDIPDAKH